MNSLSHLVDPMVKRLDQLPAIQRSALRTAAVILAAWDMATFVHSEQVARQLLVFAPPGQEEEWFWAGLLHDIGKLMTPPEILKKRGRLSRNERLVMQQHPLQGAVLLAEIGAPPTVIEGAKYHHERWDGTGYPYDIDQEQVPYIARVLAVADTYTALTDGRPYRAALTLAEARAEIERNAGTQFDPHIVRKFFATL